MKGLPIFWTRMAVELIPMSLYTHTLRVLPNHFGRETVPSGIEYYNQLFCLCGHLGGVSEIQTSLDVSDL